MKAIKLSLEQEQHRVHSLHCWKRNSPLRTVTNVNMESTALSGEQVPDWSAVPVAAKGQLTVEPVQHQPYFLLESELMVNPIAAHSFVDSENPGFEFNCMQLVFL